MVPSTEDLLKIRDGEPVEASVRAAVAADPSLRAAVERLRRTRSALQALPVLEPPPEVWSRVAAATEGPAAPPWQWPLRAAIAAGVALAAILTLLGAPEAPLAPVPSTTVSEAPLRAPGGQPGSGLATPTYASLVAESARLERQLNALGDRPRLMNAGTAATITGLEDQIALIDAHLMYSRASGLDPAQVEALQRRRVDLMNALLQVRYAHAQRSGF